MVSGAFSVISLNSVVETVIALPFRFSVRAVVNAPGKGPSPAADATTMGESICAASMIPDPSASLIAAQEA